jgi:GAF domain-containing protein
MRRGPKPAKSKEAKRPVGRKSPKDDGAQVRDLEKRLAEALERQAEAVEQLQARDRELAEALEQQTATGEILRTISQSPTDYQPVFDTIVRNAAEVCAAHDAVLALADGEDFIIHAQHGPIGAPIGMRYPMRDTAGGLAVTERRPVHVENLAEAAEFPAGRDMARRGGHRTTLCVPLLREGLAMGTIMARRADVRPFTERQIALLQTFADQAVIAIENVRLFTELQGKNRALTAAHAQVTEALEQQTATAEILRVISSSPTDVQPVFDTIVSSAARLCDGLFGALYRFDGELLHLVAHYNYTPEALEAAHRVFPGRPSRGGGPGRAILDRAVAHIPDVQLDLEHRYPAVARAVGWRSGLFVPMLREGAPIGVIAVTRAEPRPFSNSEIELLKTFADQAVIAIENVRLFTELQEKNSALTTAHAQVSETLDQQTATSEILRVISQSPTDVQPVFQAILESAVRLVQAYSGVLTRIAGDQIVLVALTSTDAEADAAIRSAFPQSLRSELPHAQAIRGRTPLNIVDAQTDPRLPEAEHVRARVRGFRSRVLVPLLRHDEAIGAISLARREPGGFTDDEIALLQTFADQAVIAIENVRLFTELQEKNGALTEALEQQTATSEILRVISGSPTDVQPVLDAVGASAARLCDAQDVSILEQDGEAFRVVAYHGATRLRDFEGTPVSRGSVAGRAILDGQLVHVHDITAESEAEFPVSKAIALHFGHRTMLAVPLLREGAPIGAIFVRQTVVRPFSDKQIDLLKTFADQAVIAIENVRLFKELQEKNRALTQAHGQVTEALEQQTATSEILGVISGFPRDVQPVFDAIISNAVRLCGGVYGIIWRFDGELVSVVGLHNLPVEGRDGLIGRFPRRLDDLNGPLPTALRTGTVVEIPDVEHYDDPGGTMRKLWRARGVKSVVMVPMRQETGVAGAISVSHPEVAAFSSDRVELLKTFARQAVIAIENVRLFNELEAANRHLEAASRHKSEFLANMSHELRTPLNAIIGFSEVLAEKMFGELNEKQEEYSKDIHASGQHLLSLINDILDLSKIEAGRMELELSDFHLPTALDSALTLVRERAGRRSIALHLSVDERLGYIQADERKVRQVVLNLLSNAIKFTPEGGRIEVAAVPKDGFVEVSVSDTGVGIAAEDQEAVFEEFRQVGTADKKVEGTGLGLTLCRKFVELHGGRIWVKSELGVGSTFTFSLPLRSS